MAGLAALLRTTPGNTPKAAAQQELKQISEALSRALSARGTEHAHRTLGRLTVVIRAALPHIQEVDGCTVVVDGVAEVGTLVGEYVQRGPSGLVGGSSAYALILADPVRDGLVLARNGDGAPLYYARTRSGALVASEPAALIAAGVPADPDSAVVERFLATGRCDDTAATFFAEIRRVLPGQVVVVTAEQAIVHEPTGRVAEVRPLPLRSVSRRVGCRVSLSAGTATALEAALRHGEEMEALPLAVFSTHFPGFESGTPEHALLGSLPRGSFRHRATPCFADELDLDSFLHDVGEPMPDLESYLIWATVRATGGEVDVLLDGATHGDHLPRLADRVASRYGVELRFPARAASGRPAADPRVVEVLAGMTDDQLTPLVHARLKSQVGVLTGLFSGRRIDAEALFRRLVVERWLTLVAQPVASARVPSPSLRVNGKEWSRHAITTEALRADDLVVERFAFHATEAADRLRQQWYLLVAAKPVAVAQGLARNVWRLRPGGLARCLARLARHEPWQVQAVIDHGGALRAAGALLLPRKWASRMIEMRAVGLPRPSAVSPANVSVVPRPDRPDLVAEQLSAVLEKNLSAAAWGGFRGCAVISGGRVIGWSGPGDPDIALALAAGDPFGSSTELTPMVIAAHAPAAAPRATVHATPSTRKAKPTKSRR
ncbi:hypothetical protein F4553_003707 [Allocatelliglobosispora scoriae]|uniref:Uncharacterized protein n=1 Tax=Allocatelliglobosispora scoriae TaxID=643052 RepID=A0A841BSE8_9ACTN|nr:hypothetical protein [Allocatelliglobosispora scoriae]MBB5870328.1 hypothetical protein [Allocatelliglobosispora scoriae]